MSTLFFKISWTHNIERFRELQGRAKQLGFKLTVKNAHTRRVPIFLFYLDRRDGSSPEPFSDLDEVTEALAEKEVLHADR